MKRYFKIGEVADMLGISTDTLRFYEKKGLLASRKDPKNGYRYYEPQEISNLMDCLLYTSLPGPCAGRGTRRAGKEI